MDGETQRALLRMYIAGVEERHNLTPKEREELRLAWLAGFIAAVEAYKSARSGEGVKP